MIRTNLVPQYLNSNALHERECAQKMSNFMDFVNWEDYVRWCKTPHEPQRVRGVVPPSKFYGQDKKVGWWKSLLAIIP